MVSVWIAIIICVAGIFGGYIIGTWNAEPNEIGEFSIVDDGEDSYFSIDFYDNIDVEDRIFNHEYVTFRAKAIVPPHISHRK